MAAAVAVSAAVSFLNISPIRILFLASIVGGVATPVSLVFLLLIGHDPVTMGKHRISPALTVCGYAVAVIVTIFGIAALVVG
jgi:Mn2+/Fe2+ NRAMP family transporter